MSLLVNLRVIWRMSLRLKKRFVMSCCCVVLPKMLMRPHILVVLMVMVCFLIKFASFLILIIGLSVLMISLDPVVIIGVVIRVLTACVLLTDMLPQCQNKKKLTIKPADGSPAYFTLVDCGKCYYCRKRHALDWARRCTDESEYWSDGCFLTLTYKPSKVPVKNGLLNLSKRDVQLFLKRLRKEIDCEIAYFFCGEYGSKRGRPHYHAIIFGWSPPDAEFLKRSYSGYPLYRSVFLEKVWSNGLCFIGLNFNRDCAAYCAKYCDKKMFRPDEWLQDRQPEFQLSSRNILGQGAIGARWCRDNFITVQRGYLNDKSDPRCKLRLPKYYYDLCNREYGPVVVSDVVREFDVVKLDRYKLDCIDADIERRVGVAPRQFDDETVLLLA